MERTVVVCSYFILLGREVPFSVAELQQLKRSLQCNPFLYCPCSSKKAKRKMVWMATNWTMFCFLWKWIRGIHKILCMSISWNRREWLQWLKPHFKNMFSWPVSWEKFQRSVRLKCPSPYKRAIYIQMIFMDFRFCTAFLCICQSVILNDTNMVYFLLVHFFM